jgi:hypothetical protein
MYIHVCVCMYVCMCEQVGNTVVKTITKPNGRVVSDKSGAQERQKEPLRRFARVMMGHQAHTHTHIHTLREVVLL